MNTPTECTPPPDDSCGSLSPEGADLLRKARDEIVAHPEGFSMSVWDCGTLACIGGHLSRQLGMNWRGLDHAESLDSTVILARKLGFETINAGPLYELFFCFSYERRKSVPYAVEKINAFLWAYGYPPDPVEEGKTENGHWPMRELSVAVRDGGDV
jgi:hypothetical protein